MDNSASVLLHARKGRHDVVGGLEELQDAVVELLLFIGAKLVAAVGLFEGLLAADVEHAGEHVSVALHCDSLHISFHLWLGLRLIKL